MNASEQSTMRNLDNQLSTATEYHKINYLNRRSFLYFAFLAIGLNCLFGLVNLNLNKYQRKQKLLTRELQQSANYYEQLEICIKNYIENTDSIYLDKARILSKIIYEENQDKYGIELFDFYSNINEKIIEKIKPLRVIQNKLENGFRFIDEDKREGIIQDLIDKYVSLGAKMEAKRIAVLLIKHYALTEQNKKFTELANIELQEANDHQWLYLKCHILLWVTKTTMIFEYSLINFNTLIELAKRIGLIRIEYSAKTALAGYYEILKEYDQSNKICFDLLKNENKAKLNEANKLAIHHILAMSLAQQGKYNESITKLNYARQLAENIHDYYNIVLSDLILSKILFYQNDYNAALLVISKTEKLLEANVQLAVYTSHLHCLIYGNKGLLLNNLGRKDKAFQYYKKALSVYTQSNSNRNQYLMSWIYLGLAENANDVLHQNEYRKNANEFQQSAQSNNHQPFSGIFYFANENNF